MADEGKSGFWAFLAGGLVGGILAILYAPDKGEETRKKVYGKSSEFYDKGEDLYQDLKVKAEKLLADSDRLMKEAGETGRGKLDEVVRLLEESREKLEKFADAGKEKFQVLKEKIPAKGESKPAGGSGKTVKTGKVRVKDDE